MLTQNSCMYHPCNFVLNYHSIYYLHKNIDNSNKEKKSTNEKAQLAAYNIKMRNAILRYIKHKGFHLQR